jgi:MFS family permease
MSLLPAVLSEYYHVTKLPVALGMIYPAIALGSFIGSPMAGLMFDRLGSFDVAIYIAASCLIVAAVIIIVLPKASFADIEPEDNRQTHFRRSTFNYTFQ